MFHSFFNIYTYIYISIYIYIYLYIYILKKEWNVLRSLRSFTFFAKEFCILCVLLGLISRQKLKKERKRSERSLKERKRMECSERKRIRCPTLIIRHKYQYYGQTNPLWTIHIWFNICRVIILRVGHPFFSKERSVLSVLFRSL